MLSLGRCQQPLAKCELAGLSLFSGKSWCCPWVVTLGFVERPLHHFTFWNLQFSLSSRLSLLPSFPCTTSALLTQRLPLLRQCSASLFC